MQYHYFMMQGTELKYGRDMLFVKIRSGKTIALVEDYCHLQVTSLLLITRVSATLLCVCMHFKPLLC